MRNPCNKVRFCLCKELIETDSVTLSLSLQSVNNLNVVPTTFDVFSTSKPRMVRSLQRGVRLNEAPTKTAHSKLGEMVAGLPTASCQGGPGIYHHLLPSYGRRTRIVIVLCSGHDRSFLCTTCHVCFAALNSEPRLTVLY